MRSLQISDILKKKLPSGVIYMSDCFETTIDAAKLEKYSDNLLLTFDKKEK